MNNSQFLDVLKNSFMEYLRTGARSNKKLVILHGAIAEDLSIMLVESNNTGVEFCISALGFRNGKECKIQGRYIEKAVDIVVSIIKKNKEDKIIKTSPAAGIAIKFVMGNYSQNSNNYFENMLGETANIRCNNIPYFQILIIPEKLPYWNNKKEFERWEEISSHNLEKYIRLSTDNAYKYMHTPDKTLIYIVKVPIDVPTDSLSFYRYKDYYFSQNDIKLQDTDIKYEFGDNVIYNNYEEFIKKIVHAILSL